MFQSGYIDSWGRGTLKIYEACKEMGLPEPEITSLYGGILVTIFKKIASSSTDQVYDQSVVSTETIKSIEQLQKEFGLLSERITLGKEKNINFLRGIYGVNTEEIQKKHSEKALFVLELITIKPDLTRQNIAGLLGISLSTIEKNIKILRDAAIIGREGTDKVGYWKIIKQK